MPSSVTHIGVISDTHMPRKAQQLPPACVEVLRGSDLIIHAGDHSDAASLAALRAIGPPVVAVHGNVDGEDMRAALPATAAVTVAGHVLAVVHDAGPAAGRPARLRRRFPEAGAVVFGHSHIPLVERAEDGFVIVNPGSPTDRRRQPRHTMARLVCRVGRPLEVEIIALDDPR